MATTFPMMGDTNNAGSMNYGVTKAGLDALQMKILAGFINEVWFMKSKIPVIFSGGHAAFKNGGWEATFRRKIRATVKDYVQGKGITYDKEEGWTEFTVQLDQSAYGTYTMNDLQRAIMQNDVYAAAALLKDMSDSLATELEQKQWNQAMTYLHTKILSLSAMANAQAQTGLYYKGVAKDLEVTGNWIPTATEQNVMAPFRRARIAAERMGHPENVRRKALVSPEIMDALTHMEKNHFSVGSSKDEDAIMRGMGNEMIVSGCQVIQTPWLQGGTVNSIANQHPILFFATEGAHFQRVLDENDQVRPESDFATAFRQLSAWGTFMTEQRYFGIDWLKVTPWA